MITNKILPLILLIIFAINILIGLPVKILKYLRIKDAKLSNINTSKENFFENNNEVFDVEYKDV